MALTLTTEEKIIRLAGVGANPAITSVSATVVSIGEDAEGEFISDTRRDWITDFSSVNTYIKKKVSNAVATKAAMQIVSTSTADYDSTREQETILDKLDNDYQEAVRLLSKLDHNDIRSINS